MTQLSKLPRTTTAWTSHLTETLKIVDSGLSSIAVHRGKCRVISAELAKFLDCLTKRTVTLLTQGEITRLFEFTKALLAFVGYLAQFQKRTWLGAFLNNSLSLTYEDMAFLWITWSDAAETFCFPCFTCLDALAFEHTQDLLTIYTALLQGYKRFSSMPQVQSVVDKKLREIVDVLEATKCSDPDTTNCGILKQTDWTITRTNVGSGHCAIVHQGKLVATGEEVAIKELHQGGVSQEQVKDLKRDNTLCHMNHPNLLKMIGVTVTQPFCICTAFLPNGPLSKWIHEDKLTGLHSTKVAMDIAMGLEYLHAQGMIHKNLKPRKILLDNNKRAIICDYGLTRIASPHMSYCLGTVRRMAPELMTGGKHDKSVDVYTFGMILYELGTKRKPFEGLNVMQIAGMVLAGERPELPASMPQGMKDLITKCWAQNPADRPSVQYIIEKFLSGEAHFEGCNSVDLHSWAKQVKQQHDSAMEALAKQPSNIHILIARLSNLSPLDPLVEATLEHILKKQLADVMMLEDLVNLATQKLNAKVQDLALHIIEDLIRSNRLSASKIYDVLLKLWDEPKLWSEPEMRGEASSWKEPPGTLRVVCILKYVGRLSDSHENRHSFWRSILVEHTQDSNTVKVVEAIAERKDLAVIFEFVDPSLMLMILSFALSKFGPTPDMVPAVVWSFPALALILRTVAKTEKYTAVFLSSSDAKAVEDAVTMLSTGYFMNSPDDLMKIITTLSPLLKNGGPGMATLELLNAGARFQKVADLITELDFSELIRQCLDSPRNDVCESAVSLLAHLRATEATVKVVGSSFLRYLSRSHSDTSFKVLRQLWDKFASFENKPSLVYSLITGLSTPKADEYVKLLFSLNMASDPIVLDKTFWKLTSLEIPKLQKDEYVAAIAIFYLKYKADKANDNDETRRSVISYDLLGAFLNFVYSKSIHFARLVPILQVFLSAISEDTVPHRKQTNAVTSVDVAIFLCHHNFIQYLHQLPHRYPNELKVTAVLRQFMIAFEAAAKPFERSA